MGVDNVPRSECNSSDHRFTLIPITAATGEVIMCVVIFQYKQKEVSVRWQLGIDVRVQPEKDEMVNIFFDKATTNHGPGKYLPGGPTCIYNGETIPCAMYVSESVRITADILSAVLTVLDELDVFPRDSRIAPFMLIDGHSSKIYPKFLTYINNCNHQWKVCLDVPYTTSLWQVGDSKEQNGTFKGEWYRSKTSLYEYKQDFDLELKTR